ncbi:hypothetical protein [Flavobacterium sp. ASV13]|uniref:hypothetical protein n=1 Tax=Flavobacterium sp. ASV13 TaxID=1506583 RepID=UPI0005559F17|nr:hypothetical protein [Flavobacterium sp. ASV13]
MKSVEKIQNLIPLGYLFLVIMGIMKESVFYYQLKINILKYSTIMDILISPIADLTSTPILMLGFIFFIIVILLILTFAYHNRNKSWIKKVFNINENGLSNEALKSKLTKFFLIAISLGILSFFLGLGIGGGMKMAKKIKENKLVYKQKLTFTTGETENVFLIDANSAYYFYLTPKSKSVQIAPIGAIKNIVLN